MKDLVDKLKAIQTDDFDHMGEPVYSRSAVSSGLRLAFKIGQREAFDALRKNKKFNENYQNLFEEIYQTLNEEINEQLGNNTTFTKK